MKEIKKVKWAYILSFLTFVIVIIDSLMTNFFVIVKKTHIELNPITLKLWSLFGSNWGEAVRLSLFFGCFIYLLSLSNHKNEKLRDLAFILIVVCSLIWFFTLVNNVFQSL
jgi:hypothetical protein